MIRVTYEEVQGIFETDLTELQINNFIRGANLIVENSLVPADALDDATLKEIELYLAAHLCCMRDQRVSSNSVRNVSESYQYKLGLRLEVTMYGQQCLIFDTTGILHNLNKGRKSASMSFIGGNITDKLSIEL